VKEEFTITDHKNPEKDDCDSCEANKKLFWAALFALGNNVIMYLSYWAKPLAVATCQTLEEFVRDNF
jgi:hypothetical protein